MPGKLWTEELKDVIVASYEQGATIKQISERLNRRAMTIKDALHRWGVRVRPRGKRTISVNEDYFTTVDTEEKAYWLGFLMADGCVRTLESSSSDSCLLLVGLSAVDRGHLEKLKTALAYEGRIKERYGKTNGKVNPSVTLAVFSKKMVQSLINLGCVPRKSYGMETPKLNESLMRHFYRGHFDGDGYLGAHKSNGQWFFCLTGCSKFIEEARDWYCLHAQANKTKIRKNGSGVAVQYGLGGARQVERVMHLLYDDATIYLDRKKAKVEELFRQRSARVALA